MAKSSGSGDKWTISSTKLTKKEEEEGEEEEEEGDKRSALKAMMKIPTLQALTYGTYGGTTERPTCLGAASNNHR